jgi:Skp family chaperone for outer membrane proteins
MPLLYLTLETCMKFSHKSLLAVALVLAGAMLARAQTPAGNAAPPPTRIAVVNIVDLFDGLLEKANADTEIDNMKQKFDADGRKQQAALETLQNDLKNYNPNSAQYKQTQDDLLQKSIALQTFSQFAQQKLLLELRLRTADLYRKINESVAAYAQANGIAMVFVADNINLEAARSQEQLQAMVTIRKVLYVHPTFDITTQIKQKLNAEYQLGTGKK